MIYNLSGNNWTIKQQKMAKHKEFVIFFNLFERIKEINNKIDVDCKNNNPFDPKLELSTLIKFPTKIKS
tara:strand:+ start:275 stop:481 length:207 start_codon:yes stop_codon:yes gene_type:complete